MSRTKTDSHQLSPKIHGVKKETLAIFSSEGVIKEIQFYVHM